MSDEVCTRDLYVYRYIDMMCLFLRLNVAEKGDYRGRFKMEKRKFEIGLALFCRCT
jgi:hypothetical protein